MIEIFLIEKQKEGYYELNFYNSPALAYFIQKIPSARFIIRDRCWRINLQDRRFLKEFCEYAVKRGLASGVHRVDDRSEILGFPERMPDLQYPITHLKLSPYDYQRKGIQYMIEHKRCFNGDDMGLGKEQPYSEPVLTPKGFIKMGELKVGDTVIGADGEPAKITHIYEQGDKDVYKVSFSDGTYARCGLNHLWNVISPNWKRHKSGYKTVMLADILNDVYYEVYDKRDGKMRKNYKYSIPLCEPVQFDCNNELPIEPYALGVLLGDGRLCNTGDKVSDFRSDNMTFSITSAPKARTSKTMAALRRLGLWGVRSKDKFIPDCYKFSSIENRRGILQGLIDTDGYKVKEGFIEYCTASKRLMEDVSFMARSLGYMVRTVERYSRYEQGGKQFRNYRVYIYEASCRKNKAIVNIEKVGRERSRCIVVDNSAHLYLTRDFIVTHNTMQSIAAVSIARAYPCLVVAPAAMKVTWQREFQRFIGKQAIILSNENKDNWHRYFETGTCNVFITNYESVKKYFVSRVRGRTTVKNIVLDKRAGIFKSVIIDESHRCLAGETNIATEAGIISIREIVENNMVGLRVFSYDSKTKEFVLRPIKRVYKNDRYGRKLYRVSAGGRSVVATENHSFQVLGEREMAVQEIYGETLLALRENFSCKNVRSESSGLLQSQLCHNTQAERSSKTISVSTKARAMQDVRQDIRGNAIVQTKVLFTELCHQMEDKATRISRQMSVGRGTSETSRIYTETDAECGASCEIFGEDESQQPDVQRGNSQENDCIVQRENHKKSWRERTLYALTNYIAKRNESRRTANSNGIRRKDSFYQRFNRKVGILLQNRCSIARPNDCNRSRRRKPQRQKTEIARCEKESCIEFVRVDGLEVLQQGDYGRNGGSSCEDTFVYDLEIEGTHTYFANGLLVHNCCNTTALWSLYLEAICANKEYIWLLTGTPIVTSNEDLVQQLRIMRRLDDFGGAARFRKRYCQGPDKSSNLYELHYRLWQTCYFRREKSLALKDLPEKTRQYLTVDIANRKEYEFAENDLIRYLVEYESASDAKLRSAAKATAMVQINHLRQISARGKMDEAIRFIHDVIDGGDKLIVFAFHKSVITEVMKSFPGCVSVTGSDSQEQKQTAIDKFQNNPDCNLIALNYKSGGVGITLTAASRVLFIEFPWTASDCEQAECRAHRNGQKNAVNCYYLLARNTIDERILEIIQKERDDSSVVTGADNNIEERIVDMALRHYKDKHKI